LDAKPRLIFITLFLGFSGASTFCRSRDHFPKEWHYSAIRRIAYPDKWVHRPAPKLEREPRHVRTLSIASGRGIVGNSAAFISGSNIAALLQFRIYLIQDAYILEYCLVKELRVSLWLSEQPFQFLNTHTWYFTFQHAAVRNWRRSPRHTTSQSSTKTSIHDYVKIFSRNSNPRKFHGSFTPVAQRAFQNRFTRRTALPWTTTLQTSILVASSHYLSTMPIESAACFAFCTRKSRSTCTTRVYHPYTKIFSKLCRSIDSTFFMVFHTPLSFLEKVPRGLQL
jgi:hypothetical protein